LVRVWFCPPRPAWRPNKTAPPRCCAWPWRQRPAGSPAWTPLALPLYLRDKVAQTTAEREAVKRAKAAAL
jgi:hypothetical protein